MESSFETELVQSVEKLAYEVSNREHFAELAAAAAKEALINSGRAQLFYA